MPAPSVTTIDRADVVVVGARCAGSAAALTLAKAGRRVVAIDAARFPSDTLSTHLLWPSGLAEIERLGALDAVAAIGAPKLTHAMAAIAGYKVASRFPAVGEIDYAMCVRRTGLDDALLRTAVVAGVELRERCRVTDLLWDGERCAGVRYIDADGAETELRATLVIGADGRRSTVARLAGVEEPFARRPSGRDCYYAYWKDTRDDWRHIAAQWRTGSDLGTAFPCDDGLLLCLVQPAATGERAGVGAAEARYAAAIENIPELVERLHGCTKVGRVRSATDIASYFRHSSGPGWALPGDAGHFKDPVTAQGIRDALRYGRLLGEAAAPVLDHPQRLDRALRDWEQTRVRDCVDIYQWTNKLARGETISPLEHALYRAADTDPAISETVIAIFSRTVDPSSFYTPQRAGKLALRALWNARADPLPVLADIARTARDTVAELAEARDILRRAHRRSPSPSRPTEPALTPSSPGDDHA
ncbi:NAD(P)/FAD-dependent oxidoreductase [Nocardia sp. NPDC057227]|uniref:NAD(P)/FAD-dependent oxidoreductase n=1 Tax=Nocardia sp. NPDC057227 TaxID=3346056 RepID=UPI00363E4657